MRRRGQCFSNIDNVRIKELEHKLSLLIFDLTIDIHESMNELYNKDQEEEPNIHMSDMINN